MFSFQNQAKPANSCAPSIIVTGSHTSTLQKASSANYGSSVDLSAQGASITVNDKLGKVGYAGGTSFAAPLVVSALSLYLGLNKNPNVTVNEVLSDLFNSSNNYYAYNSGVKISNYGRLNAQAFVQAGMNRGL